MKISEMKNYYLLSGEIKNEEEKIAQIEAKLCASPAFDTSGIPKNPSPGNRVEQTYIELITRKEELQRKVSEYKKAKTAIEEFIDNIDDLLVHRIAYERFIKNKRFSEIADELGGKNTADSVKKMLYRYLAGIRE